MKYSLPAFLCRLARRKNHYSWMMRGDICSISVASKHVRILQLPWSSHLQCIYLHQTTSIGIRKNFELGSLAFGGDCKTKYPLTEVQVELHAQYKVHCLSRCQLASYMQHAARRIAEGFQILIRWIAIRWSVKRHCQAKKKWTAACIGSRGWKSEAINES